MSRLFLLKKPRLLKLTAVFMFFIFLSSSVVTAGQINMTSPNLLENINIPANAERIDDLFIPEGFGSIEKRREPESEENSKFIILIKDAHCHYEAQHNIAKILEVLVRDYGVDIVGVEGAEGDLNLSQYEQYSNEKIKEKAVDMYIKKGYATGAEYLNITRYNKLPFGIYGIEDGKLYVENFIKFRETWANNNEIEYFIKEVSRIIAQLKGKIYSKELFEIDRKEFEYVENKISLTDWVKYLNSQKPAISRQKNYDLVLRAIRLEERIDFKKIEKERAEIIKILEKKLSKEALEELIRKSLEFRLGKISQAEYYKYIEQHILEQPCSQQMSVINLKRYIHLIKIQSRIDSDGLFSEIELVTIAIKKTLFQNELQKKLDNLSRRIQILNKLFRLQLQRKDLEYLRINKDEFNADSLLSLINIQAPLNNITVPPMFTDVAFLIKLNNYIIPADRFYEIAIERDRALVEKTLKKMEEENKEKAIMVVGGFHSEGITKILQDKNVNYVVISPKITKEQLDNPYLSIMLDKKIDYNSQALLQNNLANPELLSPMTGPIRSGSIVQANDVQKGLEELIRKYESGEISKDELKERVLEITKQDRAVVEEILEKISSPIIKGILGEVLGLETSANKPIEGGALKIPGMADAELDETIFNEIMQNTAPAIIDNTQLYQAFVGVEINDRSGIMDKVSVYFTDKLPPTMHAYGKVVNGELIVIINKDYINQEKVDYLKLAEVIDHEWTEHMTVGGTHRKAAARQKKYFGKDKKGNLKLTPYHEWAIDRMDKWQLESIIEEYNKVDKEKRGWGNYEEIFNKTVYRKLSEVKQEDLLKRFEVLLNQLPKEIKNKILTFLEKNDSKRLCDRFFNLLYRVTVNGDILIDKWWDNEILPDEDSENHFIVRQMVYLALFDKLFEKTAVSEGDSEWIDKFNRNERDDLFETKRGFSISLIDETGAIQADSTGTLPSFQELLIRNSAYGVLLEMVLLLYPKGKYKGPSFNEYGFDENKVYEKLFERSKEFVNFSDFLNYLDGKIIGLQEREEDHYFQLRGLFINNPTDVERMLQTVFNDVMQICGIQEKLDSYYDNLPLLADLSAMRDPWQVIFSEVKDSKTMARGWYSRQSTPWRSNSLRLNNGFWELGPEKALGLVSRGIRGGLSTALGNDGFMAGNAYREKGADFLPMSCSKQPYGGAQWANGIITYFEEKGLDNITSEEELARIRSVLEPGFTTFLTDTDEVVLKNKAGYNALRYLFVTENVFEENKARLEELRLLERVIVFGRTRESGIFYYRADSPDGERSIDFSFPPYVLGDMEFMVNWVTRIVITRILTEEYINQIIDGKTRGERIIEKALELSNSNTVFAPEEVAENLREDLDIIIDVLVNQNAYQIERTKIDRKGKRTLYLKKKEDGGVSFTWDDINKALSPFEQEQYTLEVKKERKRNAGRYLLNAYPTHRVGIPQVGLDDSIKKRERREQKETAYVSMIQGKRLERTERIKIAEVLGINVGNIDDVLMKLDDSGISRELSERLLRLMKADGIINSEEVQTVVDCIGQALKAVEIIADYLSDAEKKEAVKRLGAYLAILKLQKQVQVQDAWSQLPNFTNQLRDKILEKATMEEGDVKALLLELIHMDTEFVYDSTGNLIDAPSKLEVYLNNLIKICGEEIRPLCNELIKYKQIQVKIIKALRVDTRDIEEAAPARNIAEVMNSYLRDKKNKNLVANIIVRYLMEPQSFSAEDAERIKKIINRSMEMREATDRVQGSIRKPLYGELGNEIDTILLDNERCILYKTSDGEVYLVTLSGENSTLKEGVIQLLDVETIDSRKVLEGNAKEQALKLLSNLGVSYKLFGRINRFSEMREGKTTQIVQPNKASMPGLLLTVQSRIAEKGQEMDKALAGQRLNLASMVEKMDKQTGVLIDTSLYLTLDKEQDIDGGYIIHNTGEGGIEQIRRLKEKGLEQRFLCIDENQAEAFRLYLAHHGIEYTKDEFLMLVDYAGMSKYIEVKKKFNAQRVVTLGNPNNPENRRFYAGIKDRERIIMHEDLILATRVASLFGGIENLDNDSIKQSGLKIVLEEYYKNSEFVGQIDKLIEEMLKNSIWCLILPPMVPFVKEYYNTLKGARELIQQAA